MSTRRARGENCSDGWGPCALVDGRPDSVSPLSQGSNGPRKSLSTLKMALLKPSRAREKGGGDAASVGMTGGWSGLLANPGPCAWDPRKPDQASSKARKAWFFGLVCQSPGQSRNLEGVEWRGLNGERLWLADHVTAGSKRRISQSDDDLAAARDRGLNHSDRGRPYLRSAGNLGEAVAWATNCDRVTRVAFW